MPDNTLKNIPKEKITPSLLEMFREQGMIEDAKMLEEIRDNTPTKLELKKFVTQNQKMIQLKERVEKLSEIDYPVLIQGETGTGKEILATALHGNRKGRFLAINCAATPDTLIDAELFGHTKGAYTGADRPRTGLLQDAKDGTMFLDEIGDLPLSSQGKLLRAIQEKKVRPLGATEDIEVNCRFICATHRDLIEMCKVNLFREDLYWRISTFILRPTPLRERANDILPIVMSIDEARCIKDYRIFCSLIDKDQLNGNVRSLQQMVLRYCILGIKPYEEEI